MIEEKIFCVTCNRNVKAMLVTGKEIYPYRKDLWSSSYYRCPNCNNYVGVHKHTFKPLGCIPSKDLRKKRMQVHSVMDKLWKNKLISRDKLYSRLNKELGYNYHNGTTTSVEECDRALEVVSKISRELGDIG